MFLMPEVSKQLDELQLTTAEIQAISDASKIGPNIIIRVLHATKQQNLASK